MIAEKFSERGIIPVGTVAVTIGIDTQADGFIWVLSCWGRRMELWLPLTGELVGDLRGDDVWQELADVLGMTWLDRDGNAYRSTVSAMDVQGDNYSSCLEFVRTNGFRLKLKAVRGWAPARGVGARSIGILRNAYQDPTTRVVIQNIDVDAAKSWFANLLAKKDPIAVHLPRGENGEDVGGWTCETIAELTAEYRKQTNLRGYVITRWHKRAGRANHRLDAVIYSMAALQMSRLKIDSCELQRTEAKNLGKPVQKAGEAKPSPFGARPIKVLPDLSNWQGYTWRPPGGSPYGATGGGIF